MSPSFVIAKPEELVVKTVWVGGCPVTAALVRDRGKAIELFVQDIFESVNTGAVDKLNPALLTVMSIAARRKWTVIEDVGWLTK